MDNQINFDSIPNLVNSTIFSSQIYHLVSGSFRSLSIFLLAFSPANRTLSLVEHAPAFGPHQYLATNERRDRIYATSWALPPVLSSWSVERETHSPWRLEHINSVPITATSSYLSLPAPYTHIYSAGGPTGEVHAVDASTGGFGEKVQEYLFVLEDELVAADKTRVALRYGSHAVEISSQGHAFIPVLGTSAINMYSVDRTSGHLHLLSETNSPRDHDGPRHVVISPNGRFLYSVTEHTSFVDVYSVQDSSLHHIQSMSILPPSSEPHHYRGDTLRLHPSTSAHPSPSHLFATTRGFDTSHKGFLTIFSIREDGLLSDDDNIERWETPTSGGKANAIELRSKVTSGGDSQDIGVWIALTDDEPSAGGLWMLEWDPKESGNGGVKIVADWNGGEEDGISMQGASHAIWLD